MPHIAIRTMLEKTIAKLPSLLYLWSIVSCTFVDVMENNNVDEQVYSHIIILPYQWLHFLRSHTHTHRNTRTYIVHTPFDDVHKHILLRNVDTAPLQCATWYTCVCVCVFVCLKHVYPIFNALLSHCWCVQALQFYTNNPTGVYLSSQTPYLLFSLRQSIDPKILTQCFLNASLLPICLFQSPYSQSTPCHSTPSSSFRLNFICNICNLIQIWCHIRQNKQTNTHLQLT